MLFSYIDADVGNLRKFEYIKGFLGISWCQEIQLNQRFNIL